MRDRVLALRNRRLPVRSMGRLCRSVRTGRNGWARFRPLAALAGLGAWVLAGAPGPAVAQLPTALAVSVSDGPDPAASGGEVAYSVTVKNMGGFSAHEVVVTITMPPSTAFVKCGSAAKPPCAVSGSVVTFNVGTIP